MSNRFPELHPPLTPQAAIVEANRCLYCFDAPCAGACPTHIDVPRFIKKIASGNLAGSARTILDANVLGLSCSRVCPVEVLCEGACVLHHRGEQPIRIGLLQRHAMEYFYEADGRLPVGRSISSKRVACVGAGPASLACAAELRRHGISVTVFDRAPWPGGLNTYGVAEYKWTSSDSLREIETIRAAGVEFRMGVEVGGEISLGDLERDYDAIFLGVGLGQSRKLGVPGEELEGVCSALDFIAAYKRGIPLPLGRRAVVIGGGNTAIDAAIAARRLGAQQVSVLYRRAESEMSAFRFEYEHAKREGVHFIWHAEPVALHGLDRVTAVQCRNGATIPCDTIILAIGQSAPGLPGQSANPKYFAGGDCVNGGREVVDAVAEGKRAAQGIVQWLT